jgi:hypothetical protein
MNNLIYHSNFHGTNHHTVSSENYPDSATDPIASLKFPFQGIFYNNIYTVNNSGQKFFIRQGNSYEWWSNYTTVQANSSLWNKITTTYTTVNSKSANWNKGYQAYLTMNPLSSKWESNYQTVTENKPIWDYIYDPNLMFWNRVQEYTAQKTFKTEDLNPIDPWSIVLNLTANQVAVYTAKKYSHFSNFIGGKKGGLYNLYLIMDGRSPVNPYLRVTFNPHKFKFENYENYYGAPLSVGGLYVRKIEFLCDGEYLHGKSFVYRNQKGVLTFINEDDIVKFVSKQYIGKFNFG